MGQTLNCLDKTAEGVEQDDMPDQRPTDTVSRMSTSVSRGKDDAGAPAPSSTAAPPPPKSAVPPTPVSVPVSVDSLPVYSLDDVSKHASQTDAWMVVHGKVFDVTPFMHLHPGGPFQLMRGAGQDATELFEYAHPFLVKGDGIKSMQPIGVLAHAKPPSAPAVGGSGAGSGTANQPSTTPSGSSTPAARPRAASAPRTPRPVPTGFRPAVLQAKASSADDAQTFTFRLSDGEPLGLEVGQHVDLTAGVFSTQTPVTRPYTPIRENPGACEFSVAVRLYPAGPMSRTLRQLRCGDPVHVRGPVDGPVYVDTARRLALRGLPTPAPRFSRVFMVAGGSGITPMVQVITGLGADRRGDVPSLHLLYSGRSTGSLMLSNDIRRLAMRFTNIRVLCCVTRDGDLDEVGSGTTGGGDADVGLGLQSSQFAVVTGQGRATVSTWRSFFPAADPSVPTAVLVCGPSVFNSDMTDVAVEFGIPKEWVAGF